MRIKKLTGGRFGVYYDDGRLRCVYPTWGDALSSQVQGKSEKKATDNNFKELDT